VGTEIVSGIATRTPVVETTDESESAAAPAAAQHDGLAIECDPGEPERRYPVGYHWVPAKAVYLGPAKPKAVVDLVTDEE
jgi:hypothetical protein